MRQGGRLRYVAVGEQALIKGHNELTQQYLARLPHSSAVWSTAQSVATQMTLAVSETIILHEKLRLARENLDEAHLVPPLDPTAAFR